MNIIWIMLIYPYLDKLTLSSYHIAQWKSAGDIARDVGSNPTVVISEKNRNWDMPQCPSTKPNGRTDC